MQLVIRLFFLAVLPILTHAQTDDDQLVQLKASLSQATNDTDRLVLNRNIGFYLQDGKPDKALPYHETQLALAKKLQLKLWEADAYQQVAYCNWWLINYPVSFECYTKALHIVEGPASTNSSWGYEQFSFSKTPDEARRSIIGMIHYELGGLYNSTRQFDESLLEYRKGLLIGEQLKNQKILSLCSRNIGLYYMGFNQLDSAFYYYQASLAYFKNSPYQHSIGFLYQCIGIYYLQKNKLDSARYYLHKAKYENLKINGFNSLAFDHYEMGTIFKQRGEMDSALYYTDTGFLISKSVKDFPVMAEGLWRLSEIYALQGNNDVAYEYAKKAKTLSDSLNDAYITKLMQYQNVGFDQKMRLQELEKENQQTKNRVRTYALLIGLGIFLLAVLFLYRNNRQKQQANQVLASTLSDLKATQTQLVHAEKMASLGELTAGIAHEIQNPLNFVNNFAEINNELIDEMQEENNVDELKSIASDIRQNNEKISVHGKRADAIVKSMLQHSRSSSGKKEPTDINGLCDEYLRLAYHGLRAKDKSFNAAYETHFDDSVGILDVVPQDIGRVLLNLINNAFFAVNERHKSEGDSYKPLVVVSTNKTNSHIEISVKDNGNGIPASIKEKIFQPFFTTKPTGQGTGLGLSLSYDIVKAHGGEIKVASSEGVGTEFIIQLPGA